MRPATFLTKALPLASALVLASSCAGNPAPQVGLNPPADILSRSEEPPMTADALSSEEVYERQRDAKIEWGRDNAGIIDRACWWLQDAGVTLSCRDRPPQ